MIRKRLLKITPNRLPVYKRKPPYNPPIYKLQRRRYLLNWIPLGKWENYGESKHADIPETTTIVSIAHSFLDSYIKENYEIRESDFTHGHYLIYRKRHLWLFRMWYWDVDDNFSEYYTSYEYARNAIYRHLTVEM